MSEKMFMEKLAKPAQRALIGAGYTELAQFTKVRESELLQLHGLGQKTIRQLKEALAEKGLSFKAEE